MNMESMVVQMYTYNIHVMAVKAWAREIEDLGILRGYERCLNLIEQAGA